jgi:hypothetical protein
VQAELEQLGTSTKDPNVYAAMEGGRGALLYYRDHKYDEASAALQQDSDDVFARLLLAKCYQHHDGEAASEVLKGSLAAQHTMDIDLALVQREIAWPDLRVATMEIDRGRVIPLVRVARVLSGDVVVESVVSRWQGARMKHFVNRRAPFALDNCIHTAIDICNSVCGGR